MDDLISRQRTINAIIKMLGIADESFLLPAEKAIVDCIKSQPTVQPERNGEWIRTTIVEWFGTDDDEKDVYRDVPTYKCSICGNPLMVGQLKTRYCPACGAKMEGGTR